MYPHQQRQERPQPAAPTPPLYSRGSPTQPPIPIVTLKKAALRHQVHQVEPRSISSRRTVRFVLGAGSYPSIVQRYDLAPIATGIVVKVVFVVIAAVSSSHLVIHIFMHNWYVWRQITIIIMYIIVTKHNLIYCNYFYVVSLPSYLALLKPKLHSHNHWECKFTMFL